MKETLRNRNILVFIFEILLIVIGVGGITFATSRLVTQNSVSSIRFGDYNVDYKGELDVVVHDIEPISDSLINYNTRDNVIRLEFSLRGVPTNKKENLIYDVMLSEMNIDCSLLNKYTKWNLYKNGELLSTGSFDPMFDGNVLSDNMRLTNIQEDLPKSGDNYDDYVFIIWISETCDDLESCELIDQSNIVNSSLSMKIFIALYGGAKKEFERIPNYDTSCANLPDLYNNMIPVTYSNGNWIVADSNNSDKDNKWYDYTNQKWANAVVVNGKRYNTVGEVVNKDDILGHYVWIPRYRYKLWNVSDIVSDTYNAYDEGIDIIFESGLSKVDNPVIENDKYITHPVFLDNLKGFWISKYEISNISNYKFIPGVNSYTDDTLDNYINIGTKLSTDYKLGANADSHIVNNLEWGAVLYLSHSDYGVCSGDGCSSIGINDTYISGNNKQDTTTRNVYGVYDMAGGASEYVVGNYKVGSATNEVLLNNGDTWYNGHSLISDRDYILRGGMDRGMFYFGDISMSSVKTSARYALSTKIEE